MKIGILSDAHGNLAGFNACLANMGVVDQLIFTGDVLGYYFEAPQIIDKLIELNANCILGNHDEYFLAHHNFINKEVISSDQYHIKYGPSLKIAAKELAQNQINWLNSLPTELNFKINSFSIKVVHGSPWKIDEYIYPNSNFDKFEQEEADIIIMGHSHRPMIKEIYNKILFNVGSCGQPRDGNPQVSYGLIELNNNPLIKEIFCSIHRVEYDSSNLIQQCNKLAPNHSILTKYL